MTDETIRYSWKTQRVYSRRAALFLSLMVLLLVLQSCGAQDVDSVRWDATSQYLEEVVPPCVPLWDSSHDPCPVEVPPIVDVHSIAGSSRRWPSQGFTWTEILLGYYTFTLATHLVVRGEAKFDTTRCETYPLRLESFWYDMFPDADLYFMALRRFRWGWGFGRCSWLGYLEGSVGVVLGVGGAVGDAS